MSLQVVQCERIAPQPWKNGGGETRELFVWPPGGPWSLRISVADIRAEGPFSPFPGIERWFTVLEGDGVVLTFPQRRVMLDSESAPLHFDGSDAPDCELNGGPSRDLNLMVRHDAGCGLMQRATAGAEWPSHAPLRAVFTTGPALLQINDTDAARLPAWSLAISTHGANQRWRIDGDAPLRAWWLAFEPKGRL
jgi:environmental stress-induced protein Ves